MRDVEEIRTDFLLDPDVIYLNHGAYGATPKPVLDYQRDLREELECQPVAFLARKLPERLTEVRAVLGDYLRVSDPERIVFLSNVTTALNAVAQSAALGPDDEILVTDQEYGAMCILWDEIARRTGARVVTAHLPVPARTTDDLCDAVWGLVSPRTRILFFSHITSETALLLPAEELCRRAHARGVLSVVDGAHAPGHIDLDLESIGADLYAGNGHKWLCSPKGAAFLYAGEEVQEWLGPPVVSWGWRREGEGAFQSRFAWSGTDDPTAVLSLPAAIRYQDERGWLSHRERCRQLAQQTQAQILEGLGGETIADPTLQAPQMVAFPVPHDDPEQLQRALRDDFRIEVPVHRSGEQTLVRLSVPPYTTEDDCAQLVTALLALVTGRRAH